MMAGNALQDEEVDEGNDGYDETVVGKGCQRRLVHEFQEPEDRDVGDDEGRNEADDDHDQVVAAEVAQALQEVVETGDDHDRYGDDEGKVSCCFPAEAQEKAAGNGRTGTGEAGP